MTVFGLQNDDIEGAKKGLVETLLHLSAQVEFQLKIIEEFNIKGLIVDFGKMSQRLDSLEKQFDSEIKKASESRGGMHTKMDELSKDMMEKVAHIHEKISKVELDLKGMSVKMAIYTSASAVFGVWALNFLTKR